MGSCRRVNGVASGWLGVCWEFVGSSSHCHSQQESRSRFIPESSPCILAIFLYLGCRRATDNWGSLSLSLIASDIQLEIRYFPLTCHRFYHLSITQNQVSTSIRQVEPWMKPLALLPPRFRRSWQCTPPGAGFIKRSMRRYLTILLRNFMADVQYVVSISFFHLGPGPCVCIPCRYRAHVSWILKDVENDMPPFRDMFSPQNLSFFEANFTNHSR